MSGQQPAPSMARSDSKVGEEWNFRLAHHNLKFHARRQQAAEWTQITGIHPNNFHDSLIVAERLRGDEAYKTRTASHLQRRLDSSKFRQQLRPAENLRSLRGGATAVPVDLDDRVKDIPSVTLGMSRAGRRGGGRYFHCCNKADCADRVNGFIHALNHGAQRQETRASAWQPGHTSAYEVKHLPYKRPICMVREQVRGEYNMEMRKQAMFEKMHKLRVMCKKIHDVKLLQTCKFCHGATAFDPVWSHCCCTDEDAGYWLRRSMAVWCRVAHTMTQGNVEKRALLGKVLDEYADTVGARDRFEIFFKAGPQVETTVKSQYIKGFEAAYGSSVPNWVMNPKYTFQMEWTLPRAVTHTLIETSTPRLCKGSARLAAKFQAGSLRQRMIWGGIVVLAKRKRPDTDEHVGDSDLTARPVQRHRPDSLDNTRTKLDEARITASIRDVNAMDWEHGAIEETASGDQTMREPGATEEEASVDQTMREPEATEEEASGDQTMQDSDS